MGIARYLVFFLALSAFAANVKLYMKDGEFHLVREYKVEADRVRYYSVERSDWEEVPLALVDLKRTEDETKARQAAIAEEAKLITADQRQSIVDAAFREQHDDGGWSMASLGAWKRLDGTAIETKSDGYATGLTALALQRAGFSARDGHVSRALAWLERNQVRATGQWIATSLNKERDPATDIGKFMSDAATGFAVLALAQPRDTRSSAHSGQPAR